MEKNSKEVARSSFLLVDIQEIYLYGKETFGERAANLFYEDILLLIRDLENQYLMYPECRHLPTKSKKYRNIILGSYLIIYRVTSKRIEVLRALHGSQSPKIIQQARSIKIK